MSDGGSGWRGIPPAQRKCQACGVKIVLETEPAPLWFAENPWRVYHFNCALQALRAGRLDPVT